MQDNIHMAFVVKDLIDLAILIAFYYLASAIISAAMFSKSVKRWSWLNLIMAIVVSLVWFVGTPWGLNNALMGLIIAIISYYMWTTFNNVTPYRAVRAAIFTMILWMTFCWLLLQIFYLFEAESIVVELNVVASAALLTQYFQP